MKNFILEMVHSLLSAISSASIIIRTLMLTRQLRSMKVQHGADILSVEIFVEQHLENLDLLLPPFIRGDNIAMVLNSVNRYFCICFLCRWKKIQYRSWYRLYFGQ